MIHSVTCKNFYSFGDLAEISFVVGDNAPHDHGYFTAPSGTRLSKVAAVIGPNASGKTNLLKVLPFLKWLIVDSFNLPPQASLPIRPFMFKGHRDQPVEISVVFEIGGRVYTYSFSLESSKILSEELKLSSLVKEKKSVKKLFGRVWNEATGKYDLSADNFALPKGFDKLLRQNASVVSVSSRFNHDESQQISKVWQQLETNVVEAGWIGDQLQSNAVTHLAEAINAFSENSAMKKEAEKLLARFDLGLEAFDIKKEKMEDGLSFKVRFVHSFDGRSEALPMQYESSGTIRLFMLLKSVLQALAQGSTAVLDEIDVNLHPEIVVALYELFVHPETNPANAQLLFSTHSHLVMSRLDKYQIILIEKNEQGISEAWRLDEMTGVRSDDNYLAKYLAGAYGAVPRI